MKRKAESEKEGLTGTMKFVAAGLNRTGCDHPSPAELAAYAGRGGKSLESPVVRRVACHLEDCAACRELLHILKDLEGEERDFGAGAGGESLPALENARGSAERAARIRSVFFDAAGRTRARSPRSCSGLPSVLRKPAAAALALAAACVLILVGLQLTDGVSGPGGERPFFSGIETNTLDRSRGNGLGAHLPKDAYEVRCVAASDAWIYCFRLDGRGEFANAFPGSFRDSFVKAEAGQETLIPDENAPPFQGPRGEIILLAAYGLPLGEKVFAALPPVFTEEWNRRPAPETEFLEEAFSRQAAYCETVAARLGPDCLSVTILQYPTSR